MQIQFFINLDEKLRPVLIKASIIDQKLLAKKRGEKLLKDGKYKEAITAKHYRARKKVSLSSEEKKIMKVKPKIIQIQTKLMTNIDCKSKKQ